MKSIPPIALGAAGGYAWYRLVGCNGGCLLWSNPFVAASVGAFLGWTWTGGLKTGSAGGSELVDRQKAEAADRSV